MSNSPPIPRADEIYFAAVEIEDEAKRRDYVRNACAGDDALYQDVLRLFGMEDRAEQLFQAGSHTQITAMDVASAVTSIPEFFEDLKSTLPDDDEVGKLIGNYKLLQKIGAGGVGNVYLAEQTKPVRRQVALKIIKAGMDTKSVIARFEAERQVLAMMEHPNIAHVLNAGETETGRPYFVMDLVHGERITTYCDEQKIGIHQRLELFIQICHAIHHAHQKGIIHRDIKPSNVLITQHNRIPRPIVIDFGIAKATGEDLLTEKTVNTGIGPIIGTPAYMSPEQTNLTQIDIDTRCDIYSLGALLYELLTGKPPFDHRELLKVGIEEMCRILRKQDPPPIATRLQDMPADEQNATAENRSTETRFLYNVLRDDLSWITQKAMNKERDRRYESVSELAADIQRFLDCEPVLARPPSRIYLFQKLVRRNRAACAYIAIICMAVLAGLGASTWLFIRERETRRSEQKLLAEADARTQIAQAALLLSRGKKAEANQMMAEVTIPVVKPSLEAAGVFRTLGEWNVMRSQWDAAADDYLKLQQANRLDKSNTTAEMTRDLLGAGPALIVAGQFDNYHLFVQDTLDRFAGTTDPSAAEQVIKNSLIVPQDETTLREMAPFVQVVTESIEAADPQTNKELDLFGWRTLALALYEFRAGHYEKAESLATRGLKDPVYKTAPYIAMDHAVLAMTYAKLGHAEQARRELKAGQELTKNRLSIGENRTLDVGNSNTGVWHDWVIAHLLLQEAEPQVASAAGTAR